MGHGVLRWKGKGDKRNLDSHRLIVFLSVMTRLLAKIVATRLRTRLEGELHPDDPTSILLPATQWGFRPRRSTLDALLFVRAILELSAE
eukprot:5648024-Heterocapsa_arctica.AAC.1